jgi:hypothetical protein
MGLAQPKIWAAIRTVWVFQGMDTSREKRAQDERLSGEVAMTYGSSYPPQIRRCARR